MAAGGTPREVTGVFVAERLRFRIATTTADDRVLVERIFHDLREATPGEGPVAQFSLRRTVDDASQQLWTVSSPRAGRHTTVGLSDALAWLRAAINVAALDAAPENLHLHAAAASRQGRAVVLAAARNTGKTTTVANLVLRGWSFITDETVSLSPADRLIRGTPKPISVKPGGASLLGSLREHLLPDPQGDDAIQFLSVGSAGTTITREAQPHLVIMLRRSVEPSSTPSAVPLHPADAVVSLMQETLDAQRFGANAALRLAQLAAVSRCFEVTVGPLPATIDLIQKLFDEAPAAQLEVVPHEPHPAIDPAVSSLRVGERSVVHHLGSGLILALNPSATRMWEHLSGLQHDHEVELDSASSVAFVAQLTAHGLLAADAARG